MDPTDTWLELLNFYLIVNSGDLNLTTNDFDDTRLYEAYQENPGQGYHDMNATAAKLVLEFQTKQENTGVKNSPAGLALASTGHFVGSGENEESPNGPVPIQMPHLPDHI